MLREVANLMKNLDFRFEYLYAVSISCLVWRVMELIQFHAEIGPLIKIVEKMSQDFISFFILYLILILMFSIVGGVNFIFYLKSYHGVFESVLTVLDASIGNYHFEEFDTLDNTFLSVFGKCYLIFIVIAFYILVLNLMIAILSNTY